MAQPSAVGEARVLQPRSIEEAQEMVRQAPQVVPRGGGSKWGLADPPPQAQIVDTRGVAGVVEYDPSEFTLTALAGTPLSTIEALLAERGQYLPFDPPFVSAGATLGGAIASGISGPGRLRFGGARDFVLGIRFIDGEGRLVRGGGKVVKNAAGFDLPKLFCGSRGRLGLIVEATLKVFPRPPAFATVAVRYPSLSEAAAAVRSLLRSPLEPHAVDVLAPGLRLDAAAGLAGGVPLAPDEGERACTLLVRVGGPQGSLGAWLGRVQAFLGRKGEPITGEPERAVWEALRDLRWARGQPYLVRIHLAPALLETVEALLASLGAARHYSVGGNVAWAALAQEPDWDALARRLGASGTPAVVLRGAPPGRAWLKGLIGEAFARRVKAALDPKGRFGPL